MDRMAFVKGALEDLGQYRDNSFDLVMSFDAPISYTYPNQERVLGELVRIAKKRIVLSVTSRLGSLPHLANPIQKNQFILDERSQDPFVQWCVANRQNAIDSFHFEKGSIKKLMETGLIGGEAEIAEYEKGGTPWCITYAFLPEELKELLQGFGVKNIRLAGPGAFARALPQELLVKIMSDPSQRRDFLDVCYQYDSNPYVCGMGKDNLLAEGDIQI